MGMLGVILEREIKLAGWAVWGIVGWAIFDGVDSRHFERHGF
jgi:hypothetical protein